MSAPADPRLQLAPPGARAGTWLFVLAFALPVVVTLFALAATLPGKGTPNLVGDSLALTWTLTVGGMLLLCGALWWALAYFMQRRELLASAAMLEVRSSFYRCRTPLHELALDRARLVDLDEHTELKPTLKTNGFSIPGFRSGWFLLRNRRRTFVAIGDGRRKLWLPGNGRHDLLLETRDPAALLAHLRELAGNPRAG